MQIIEIVKSHPVPIAIGVCVLLLLMSRGSSPSNSGGAALASAAINNNTQLAGINSNMAVQLGAQATERYTASESAALSRTGIAASMFNNMITANAGVQASSNAINGATVAKSIDAATVRQQFLSNAAVQESTIAANVRENSDNLAAQMKMHIDDNNNKLSMIGAQTQGNLALMHLSGDISTAQLGMNLATLPALLQNTQEMARINGANAIQIAQINTKAANTKAQGEKNKSDWGIVSDIGSEIGKFIAMM